MLPGHPCSDGNVVNPSINPMAQNPSTPESAQRQTAQMSRDTVFSSPGYQSATTNIELADKMNSFLENPFGYVGFTQDSSPKKVDGNLDAHGSDKDTPNRAVGSMRAIRGTCGSMIRPADPLDTTPVKQLPPHLSENLKTLLARHGNNGDFGSLISPLPIAASPFTAGMPVVGTYPWPTLPAYPSPEMAAYVSNLGLMDFYGMRDIPTWPPLPVSSPSPPAINHTPPHTSRNAGGSSERCLSTGSSSSSGLSMSHLNDIIAQLNLTENSPTSSPPCQLQTDGPETVRSDNQSIYQLRHGSKPTSTPNGAASTTTTPPSSSSSPSSLATQMVFPPPNTPEYHAFLLAAANYFNSGIGGTNVAAQVVPRSSPPPSNNSDSTNPPDQQQSIEKAARIYRKAASICDATCTWSGPLPANLLSRALQSQTYSCKVFVGGVPWDITEVTLQSAFSPFGPVRVEWPGKEARYAKSPVKPSAKGKGYVYMIFDNDKSVKTLLENCVRDFTQAGEYYFQLTSRRFRAKEIRQVQIIPWNTGDSNYIRVASQRLDPKKTVFVGALHGMITAEVLCNVLNDLFGGVIYAGIDTDKYKYPIGSGRVTFNNTRSYQKAIAAAFVEIKSAKFAKKVQIDPYLEDATCSNCLSAPGPYFCREFMCFRYFCKTCWHNQHALDVMQSHKPLMRNTRRSQPQCVSSIMLTNNGPSF